jgi:APA family basic amino acid/polyamine antiporter
MAKSNSLPSCLAKVHPTRQTPYVAILVTGIIAIAFLFFKEVEVLAAISDVGIFILFFIVNLSNIVLRYRRPDLHRSWSAPLNIGRLPVISVLGVISCALMLVTLNHPVHFGDQQFSAQVVGLTIFALAIPLYFILNRK